jgi:hypothetical protein
MPPPLICRTLSSEYRLHVPSDAVRERFSFIETDPDIEGAPLETADIEIVETQGFYRVPLPNGMVAEGTSAHCIDVLHGLMVSDLLKSHSGCPMIHGATVQVGRKRLLVAGGKAAGKSTLALYLLSRGHEVEGDEHLVIMADGVVARPRTLRIKPATLTMFDTLPAAIAKSPTYTMWNGTLVHAVNPSHFGRPWRIAHGKLDGILFVEANHGGRSHAVSISQDESFRRLVANTYFLKSGIAAMAGRLRHLALATPAYSLQLGDLASAEWHLGRIAAC